MSVAIEVLDDPDENPGLPVSPCSLKILQYRDSRQTWYYSKSADSPFGRCNLYSVSFGQFGDLLVGLRQQRIEGSMAG